MNKDIQSAMRDFTGGTKGNGRVSRADPGITGGTPNTPGMPGNMPVIKIGGADNETEPLDMLINYNEKVKNRDPILFRDNVIQQTLGILIAKNKPNPLLVGPAGVGKTCIVEEIARLIVIDDPILPDTLKNNVIYELPLSNIVAGSSLVGQIEAKLKAVVDFVIDKNNNAILFIDEIHQLFGNDSQYEKIAQILKPYLARGEIRCIGATTTQEATELENDPAFNRRFSRVIVDELTKAQTAAILENVMPQFITHYKNKVAVDLNIIPEIVDLADDYHKAGSHRPDTALTLLDRAFGDVIVKRKAQEQSCQNNPAALNVLKQNPIIPLTVKQIRATAIRITTGNSKPEQLDVEHLRTALSRIRGQDKAIECIVKHLRQQELGLFPKNKPVSILFIGPSGVGKTEVTKIIAQELTGTKPIILNMTEYHSPASINRIIGSPLGYIGSTSHTELPFDSLASNPYQVILLDEFEKCDNAVKTLFMQAFDEGYIKTNRGSVIDFSKALIIATTNAGHTTAKSSMGFIQSESRKTQNTELSKYFDLALLNRFCDQITFHTINKETFREIIAQTYQRERDRIMAGTVRITMPDAIPDDVLTELVETHYNPDFGARPAERAVQNYITELAI